MLEFLDTHRQRVLINPQLIAVVRAASQAGQRGTEIVMRDGERILVEDSYEDVKARIEKADGRE